MANVGWMIGSDADMPALGTLLGSRVLGVVTIGQALHWMNRDELFPALRPLVRPGGGVAVVTNGTPLWLQDSAWSAALLDWLEQWTGARPAQACGTDEASQRRYRDSLMAAGFEVTEAAVLRAMAPHAPFTEHVRPGCDGDRPLWLISRPSAAAAASTALMTAS